MDDYLDSFPEPEQALKLSKDLVELLKLGGFKLTKFVSNVKEIQKELCTSSDNLSQVKEILSSEGQESHVLGLKWDHVLGTLVVIRGVNRELKDTVTQRYPTSFVSCVSIMRARRNPTAQKTSCELSPNIWSSILSTADGK